VVQRTSEPGCNRHSGRRLIKFGFLRERQTEERFETTRQGSATVEFSFGVFRQYPLHGIHDLCGRLEDYETLTALDLFHEFAVFTEQYVLTDGAFRPSYRINSSTLN